MTGTFTDHGFHRVEKELPWGEIHGDCELSLRAMTLSGASGVRYDLVGETTTRFAPNRDGVLEARVRRRDLDIEFTDYTLDIDGIVIACSGGWRNEVGSQSLELEKYTEQQEITVGDVLMGI